MLEFNLRNYVYSQSGSYFDKNGDIKFDPPVYEQRYAAVIKILEHRYWNGKLSKIIDFGCADMKLVTLLKRVEGVKHILAIDIDEDLLKTNIQRIKPLLADYLIQRETELRIDVYKGSVGSPSTCTKDTDVVIAVELIEHLNSDVFEELPFNIFGFIKPKLVIVTTPNYEFNVIFRTNLLENGFRHYDHKFEWTRKQFQDWGHNICKRFPNYFVSYSGVGKAPPDLRQHGNVSQIALFIRKDMLDGEINDKNEIHHCKTEDEYELLCSVDYPFAKDNRDHKQKILDESIYHINRLVAAEDRYWNSEKDLYMIPLEILFEYVFPLTITQEELKSILIDNNYVIENNFIAIEKQSFSSDEEDDSENEEKEVFIESDQNKDENVEEECWD